MHDDLTDAEKPQPRNDYFCVIMTLRDGLFYVCHDDIGYILESGIYF